MSRMFEYEVALSFAGEQRSEVSKVADCLKEAGVTFFYDEFEKAKLWGKNLYDHLSDVYQNKARYCVIFASKEYSQKAWPTLERQSAQARALQNKGEEYVLPVRFDSTEIPGIAPTIGYLEYATEGPSGICDAILQKLGKHSTHSLSPKRSGVSCTHSPRALINALDGRLAVPYVESSAWGSTIELSVRGADNDALFSQLRGQRQDVVVAYAFDVALAKPVAATRRTVDGNVTWSLQFEVSETNFNQGIEVGSGRRTADHFAQLRAERILLDRYRHDELERGSSLEEINDHMNEALIQGINQAVKAERSHLPQLYTALKQSPQDFVEVAWIVAVADLKLTGTVEIIDRLNLALVGGVLSVDFMGRRHRKFSNVGPHEIRVQGELMLEAQVRRSASR